MGVTMAYRHGRKANNPKRRFVNGVRAISELDENGNHRIRIVRYIRWEQLDENGEVRPATYTIAKKVTETAPEGTTRVTIR